MARKKKVKAKITGNKPIVIGGIKYFPGDEFETTEKQLLGCNRRIIKMGKPKNKSSKRRLIDDGTLESKRSDNIYSE